MEGMFVSKNQMPVSIFHLEDHVVTAAHGKDLNCCLHGEIKIIHTAPDLVCLPDEWGIRKATLRLLLLVGT